MLKLTLLLFTLRTGALDERRGARLRRSIIDVYVVKMARRIAEVGRRGKSNLSARSGNNGIGYGNFGTKKSMDEMQTPEHFLNAER